MSVIIIEGVLFVALPTGAALLYFVLSDVHAGRRSLTQTLVQYELAKRWNGQMPAVGGSAMPMITLPKP